MTAPVLVGPSPQGDGPDPVLTDREVDILRRQAAGEKQSEIAPVVFLTVSGVNSLSRRIMQRLGARNLPHAIHIAHELGLLSPQTSADFPAPLVEVLDLVAEGYTNEQIGRRLGRATGKVSSQVQAARRRLGARDRAHAAVLAVEAGLIRRRNRTS